MPHTQKFWTHQLIAHGWASWITGYTIAFLSMITWYIAPFETNLFWNNALLDFYSTGFLNALLLLILTPVYVTVFGLFFRITTPPLWLFIWVGIILEYAITMTLGRDFESLVNGEISLPLQKSIIAVIAGGIYGFLVHRTMDAKLNPSSQKSIPLWHKVPMMCMVATFFKGVLPTVGVAIITFFIYTPHIMDLLSNLSLPPIFLGFLSLSVLMAVGFLVLLLPYYLVLCLFEHFVPTTHKGRTLATYGVFLGLGLAHLTLVLKIINPSWDILTEAMDGMPQPQEFSMLTYTWTIIANGIIAYLYNRQRTETKSLYSESNTI